MQCGIDSGDRIEYLSRCNLKAERTSAKFPRQIDSYNSLPLSSNRPNDRTTLASNRMNCPNAAFSSLNRLNADGSNSSFKYEINAATQPMAPDSFVSAERANPFRKQRETRKLPTYATPKNSVERRLETSKAG